MHNLKFCAWCGKILHECFGGCRPKTKLEDSTDSKPFLIRVKKDGTVELVDLKTD